MNVRHEHDAAFELAPPEPGKVAGADAVPSLESPGVTLPLAELRRGVG